MQFRPFLFTFLAGLAQGASVQEVTSALESIQLHKIGDIRGNIHLPSSIDGHNVKWSSSDNKIISYDGWVYRQEKDAEITLTATIQSDDGPQERQIKANVRAAAQLAAFEGYAFAYFTGSSIAGENIFFAASNGNNALSWAELNRGQPVLKSTKGTKGLRDPFIIRSHEGDKFYLVATDLSIGSGTSWDSAVRHGSLYIEVWESNDLKNWSEQRHIKVSPSNAGNTWAPEAYYDDELGAYLVFWASELYPASDPNHTTTTYHRVLYATTRDFVTFSEPVVWQDSGYSRIDTTVLKVGNTYHRFTKDEGGTTGCADIIQESSTNLRAAVNSWKTVATCIGKKAGSAAVEGPTIFKSNPGDTNGDKYYLFVDEYNVGRYRPLQTADISKPNWQFASSYSLPTSPRHGTVIPITAKELAALKG